MSTTPRWLNAEERRAWLAYVDFSMLLGDYLNRQLRRDSGITHADYSLLAFLSATPDHTLGMSQLAHRLKITRSRLTTAGGTSAMSPICTSRSHPARRVGHQHIRVSGVGGAAPTS